MTQHTNPCDTACNRVLAAALALQQCTKTAANVIPLADTNNVIMVGSPEWIAKNVPGVEAPPEPQGALTPEDYVRLWCANNLPAAVNWAYRDQVFDFARAIESATIARLAATTQAPAGFVSVDGDEIALSLTGPQREELLKRDGASLYLAATTQASTAQAEREILLRAALDAADKWANTEHCHARDIGRGGRGDEKAVVRTENAARKAIIALAAASSTDAQAAAEVRDAVNLPDPLPLLRRLKRELEHARRFSPDTLQTYRAACVSAEGDIEEFLNERRDALRAGDTGEQADGGAHA